MTLIEMPPGQDLTDALVERVLAASNAGTPLRIVGGDTKRFYGRPVAGETLALAGHHGVLRYDPAELVITARGGTLLADIEALLARHGQRLPFEPPSFGSLATLGGTVAAGLAGPARRRMRCRVLNLLITSWTCWSTGKRQTWCSSTSPHSRRSPTTS